MAGNLPGVEAARRRRFHFSGGFSDSIIFGGHGLTRRSNTCFYPGNHESHLSSSRSFLQRETLQNHNQDEKLGRLAREAKERLDEKFRNKRLSKSESRRQNNISESMPREAEMDERITQPRREIDLHKEVFGWKKSGSKRLMGLMRFSWKSSEQDDCAVCLEKFNTDEDLVALPCAHRLQNGNYPITMIRLMKKLLICGHFLPLSPLKTS